MLSAINIALVAFSNYSPTGAGRSEGLCLLRLRPGGGGGRHRPGHRHRHVPAEGTAFHRRLRRDEGIDEQLDENSSPAHTAVAAGLVHHYGAVRQTLFREKSHYLSVATVAVSWLLSVYLIVQVEQRRGAALAGLTPGSP